MVKTKLTLKIAKDFKNVAKMAKLYHIVTHWLTTHIMHKPRQITIAMEEESLSVLQLVSSLTGLVLSKHENK